MHGVESQPRVRPANPHPGREGNTGALPPGWGCEPVAARATIQARVRPLSDSATEVEVTADIDVVGRLMQFGRGMVQDVSRQLFRQFVACVKQQLENPEAGAPPKSGEPISGLSLAAEAARSSLGRLMGRLRKGDGGDQR